MRLWKRAPGPETESAEDDSIAYPERAVSREYYGAVIGKAFESDEDAARHYFSDGWRRGVIPHPFIEAPMVRSSMDAAAKLRDALRVYAKGGVSPNLGSIGAVADRDAMRAQGMAEYVDDVDHLLASPPEVRDALPVFGGHRWGDVRAALELAAPVTRRIEQAGFLDVEHYEAQRPRPFLSWHAAWDDYITTGEVSGATPNWVFEPEWHAAHDGAQRRGLRPINQLLAYVDGGERSSGSALDRSLGPVPLARLLGDTDDEVTTVGGRTVPWSFVRDTIAADTWRPVPRSPRKVASSGGDAIEVAVVVDSRHLISGDHLDSLRELATGQEADSRFIFVLASASEDREPPLEEALAGIERVEIEHLDVGESLGTAAHRVVTTNGYEAWTLWRPGQVWKPGGLSATTRVLHTHPDAPAVAAYTPHAPQDWEDAHSAMWGSRLDAAGIVFRTARITPDPSRDYGVNAEAVIQLGIQGGGLVVEGDRFWARKYDPSMFANRAGANAARSTHARPEVDAWPHGAAVTVVIPTFEDWQMTVDAVSAVRSTSDARVVIVDNGSRRAVGSILRAAFFADTAVRYVRLPVNSDFAAASNIGARISDSPVVVFLNNDTLVEEGWLPPLVESLDSAAAVQPLLVFADGTVQSAGTVFVGGMSAPKHLLVGFDPQDVPAVIGEYEFSALTAACIAVTQESFEAVGGFDAEYVNGMEDVDLSLRLRAANPLPLRVNLASRVRHLESKTPGRFRYAQPNRARLASLWRTELLTNLDDRRILDRTALEVKAIRWADQRGSVLRDPEWVVGKRGPSFTATDRAARFRWALKTSSPGTLLGDRWGDTHFAEDLAEALRTLGQQVIVDRRSAWDRPAAFEMDDVVLALRGLHRFTPQPGSVNMLWVISHPDLVSREELASGWDRVFAAGPAWAHERSEGMRIRIDTLLQATNARRFVPSDRESERDGVLFVGRTRGQVRPVVLDAAEVAADLRVYGDDGWEQYLGRELVRGEVLNNADLPAAYAAARVVLNDHWSDMRRGGFLSNRLFDAAAAGARIVSDNVDGLDAVFAGQVRTYQNKEELRALLADDSTMWPPSDELAAIARRTAESNSFMARAEVLLQAAIESGAGAAHRR